MGIKKLKKGSHVGVVLSFVIFIIFIIFIYVVIQPSIKLKDRQGFLETLEGKIVDEASTDLTSVSVGGINQATPQCIKLVGFFTKTGLGSRFIVTNKGEDVLSAKISISGDDLLVIREGSESFFKIYESSEFDVVNTKDVIPCSPKNYGNGYNIGLVKTTQPIFESRIIGLIGDYNIDYETLKSDLTISSESEFGFGFTYNNETSIATGEREILTSIYTSEAPIQYLSKNASMEAGSLNIKTW